MHIATAGGIGPQNSVISPNRPAGAVINLPGNDDTLADIDLGRFNREAGDLRRVTWHLGDEYGDRPDLNRAIGIDHAQFVSRCLVRANRSLTRTRNAEVAPIFTLRVEEDSLDVCRVPS